MNQKLEFKINGLSDILGVFEKHQKSVRLIGGCVRDAIIGKAFSDIDIATPLSPDQVTEIFKNAGFKVIPTGIDFGTVTVLSKGNNFEITTLRKDISTDGRHAVVEYTDDYEVDAARRDFTINALSYDPFEEKIYDYFNGLEDLKNSVVKFIGIPKERIEEDYLRIMRFFRFSAFYAKVLDDESLEACKANMQGLEKISSERIHQELYKMFQCNKPIATCLSAMQESNLFKVIAPSYNFDLTDILKLESNIEAYKNIELGIRKTRLALLTVALGKKGAKDFMKELKFSNSDISANDVILGFMIALKQHEKKEDIVFEICSLWYYFHSYINTCLVIAQSFGKINSSEMLDNISYMKQAAPRMPISSEELMAAGYEGLSLGIRIKYLEKQWIKSGFSVEKDKLMGLK